MTDLDQCIICLEPLNEPPSLGSPGPDIQAPSKLPSNTSSTTSTASTDTREITTLSAPNESVVRVAALDGCNHVIHDACIKLWSDKTNSCPICREKFHSVRVFNSVNGTTLETYKVSDKRQIFDFNPHQWLAENPDMVEPSMSTVPMETSPCPICDSAEDEEVLLLCDGCDAAYHTYCVGLQAIPRGNWYCYECATDETRSAVVEDDMEEDDADLVNPGTASSSSSASRSRTVAGRGRRVFALPRTRQRVRQARRQAQSLDWQEPWNQLTTRVYDAISLDLDNQQDDDDFQDFRRTQQRHQRQQDRERRQYERWQERLNIASRLGAAEVFSRGLPESARQQLQRDHPAALANARFGPGRRLDAARHSGATSPPGQAATTSTSSRGSPAPPPPQQSLEELRAWGALDSVRAAQRLAATTAMVGPPAPSTTSTMGSTSTSISRKRRSPMSEEEENPTRPTEDSMGNADHGERKLKRPRTRRVAAAPTTTTSSHPGGPSSRSTASQSLPTDQGGGTSTESSSGSSSHHQGFTAPPLVAPRPQSRSVSRSDDTTANQPSFLSALLREVEMGAATAADDGTKSYFSSVPGGGHASSHGLTEGGRFVGTAHSDPTSPISPMLSPTQTARSSPRALSLTPPPLSMTGGGVGGVGVGRPTSPTLSSYVEPNFAPANYSPPPTSSTLTSLSGHEDPIAKRARTGRHGSMSSDDETSRTRPTVRSNRRSMTIGLSRHGTSPPPPPPAGRMSTAARLASLEVTEPVPHVTEPFLLPERPRTTRRDSPSESRRSPTRDGNPEREAAPPQPTHHRSSSKSNKDTAKDTTTGATDATAKTFTSKSNSSSSTTTASSKPSLSSSSSASSARHTLSPEAKSSINEVVRAALRPHWQAKKLTPGQYETINKLVSRMLYERIPDPSALLQGGDYLREWKDIASREVQRAMHDVQRAMRDVAT